MQASQRDTWHCSPTLLSCMLPFCLLWLEALSWDELLMSHLSESFGIFPSLPVLVAQPFLHAPLTCKLWSSFVPVMREHDAVKLYKVIMLCLLLSPIGPTTFTVGFSLTVRDMNVTLHLTCLFLWEHTLTLSQYASWHFFPPGNVCRDVCCSPAQGYGL